jgi:hypothetical protein
MPLDLSLSTTLSASKEAQLMFNALTQVAATLRYRLLDCLVYLKAAKQSTRSRYVMKSVYLMKLVLLHRLQDANYLSFQLSILTRTSISLKSQKISRLVERLEH